MSDTKLMETLPSELSNLKMPCKQLYFRGDLSLLKKRKVAIVGARKAYPYTRAIVQSLAVALKERDVVVVSGAAMGIDATAHRSAFPNTIGVLANGLDIVYPKVNRHLIEEMEGSSLLLSEYTDGVQAKNYSFVHRNRLVVALSEVLVVAQADLESGSMRSVEYALEMGKKIYVLPHRLGESEGTNTLLEQGKAILIHDIAHFADQFGSVQEMDEDAFLHFCKSMPTYDEALRFDSQKLFEYELSGKICVENGLILVQH